MPLHDDRELKAYAEDASTPTGAVPLPPPSLPGRTSGDANRRLPRNSSQYRLSRRNRVTAKAGVHTVGKMSSDHSARETLSEMKGKPLSTGIGRGASWACSEGRLNRCPAKNVDQRGLVAIPTDGGRRRPETATAPRMGAASTSGGGSGGGPRAPTSAMATGPSPAVATALAARRTLGRVPRRLQWW